MTTFNDLQNLIEAYRVVFGTDPADLINVWNYDELKNDMLKALDTGVPMQSAPEGDGNVPVNT